MYKLEIIIRQCKQLDVKASKGNKPVQSTWQDHDRR